ncbi:CopK family periplasmic copper-binding protein [Calothrix sp. FACHB-1219]|uniref:CopK family periplasmic copper-binding protein n=1 Tax=Calothrix sp. FACHB-1219 TaxID=2692778 RepID=UPI0016858E3C|nr:CopK family periplasmic copper-binding protein [Calothrix sp. FACHB-1219]
MKLNIVIAALALVTTSAFADHAAREAAKQIIPLKDGGNLYIFQDGKMGKESRVGTTVYLKEGEVLVTSDGRSIPVTSNETARMDFLLTQGHSGN